MKLQFFHLLLLCFFFLPSCTTTNLRRESNILISFARPIKRIIIKVDSKNNFLPKKIEKLIANNLQLKGYEIIEDSSEITLKGKENEIMRRDSIAGKIEISNIDAIFYIEFTKLYNDKSHNLIHDNDFIVVGRLIDSKSGEQLWTRNAIYNPGISGISRALIGACIGSLIGGGSGAKGALVGGAAGASKTDLALPAMAKILNSFPPSSGDALVVTKPGERNFLSQDADTSVVHTTAADDQAPKTSIKSLGGANNDILK